MTAIKGRRWRAWSGVVSLVTQRAGAQAEDGGAVNLVDCAGYPGRRVGRVSPRQETKWR